MPVDLAHELTVFEPDIKMILNKSEGTAALRRGTGAVTKDLGQRITRLDWMTYRSLLTRLNAIVQKAGGQDNLDAESRSILNRLLVLLNRTRSNLDPSGDTGPPSSGRNNPPKTPPPVPQGGRPAERKRQGVAVGEAESGWEVAKRRMQPTTPRPIATGAPPSMTPEQASEARKRIRVATMPGFATALDTAVNADLILRFVGVKPGKPDLAKLRHAFVATAVRHFAAEFVRTISSAPKGTSENLALGAIIATALSQTGQQFPIVPPAAVPAISVLIHKTLQPMLPQLARMAAAIAVAPGARPAMPAATHEMAW